MSVFVFYWTEKSLKTRKNRTKPVSTPLSRKKSFELNKKCCMTALNDRSLGQKLSSLIALRMYYDSCNSCMTVAITTTAEYFFEGLFKLRIHYPIDDWIYNTTGEQQIHSHLSHFTWNVASISYYKSAQGYRKPCN